jgi:hypothetical protein
MSRCATCAAVFTRFSPELEIRERKHCHEHHVDGGTTQTNNRAVARLRREYSAPRRTPHSPDRPHLTDDAKAERIRQKVEQAEPWRTEPEPDVSGAEDPLLAALLPAAA